MLMNTKEYLEIVDNIKSNIRSAQYKAAVAANKELIMLYWNIGKIINTYKSWENKFI